MASTWWGGGSVCVRGSVLSSPSPPPLLTPSVPVHALGGIYEFTCENASANTAPSLERRTAKLEKVVAERAQELRRAALKADFQAPPGTWVGLRGAQAQVQAPPGTWDWLRGACCSPGPPLYSWCRGLPCTQGAGSG